MYTGFQFGAALRVSAATIALVAGGGTLDLGYYRRALIIPAAAASLTVVLGLFTIIRHRTLAADSVA
ncbi:hypothetical protein [Gordonia jinghuaiqii]|uniref:MFS transporter n=1 Tax=Gordonia jinghuaiqii TaxID=2758710 RepID=A0A7D7R7Z7_9ACTN|nr:hypothetical protein [Gordonia jinghuaiqii]QMS99869.1 hypothetical protein H1R19_12835 [Gordonia jinghuaiqii]